MSYQFKRSTEQQSQKHVCLNSLHCTSFITVCHLMVILIISTVKCCNISCRKSLLQDSILNPQMLWRALRIVVPMFNKKTHKLTYVLTLGTSNKKPPLRSEGTPKPPDSAGLCRFRQSPAWVFPPSIHHASGFGSVSLGLGIPRRQSQARALSPNITPLISADFGQHPGTVCFWRTIGRDSRLLRLWNWACLCSEIVEDNLGVVGLNLGI